MIELGFLGGPKEEFGEMGQEPFDGAGLVTPLVGGEIERQSGVV